MWILRVSVAVGFAVLGGDLRPAPPELDARSILTRTAKVYAECESYRDSGVVTTVFVQERGRRTVKKPFTTAFVRPDRFRYEFLERRGEDEFDRYLVWQDGAEVRTWWDVRPGVEEKVSLERALAAARGVSWGSSYTIPDLLLDLTTGFPRVTQPSNAERKADADLEGTRCFVIACGTADEPVTLWIEQKTFLLRRIDEQDTLQGFPIEETTTYEPVLDGEIDAVLLAFDPPGPVQAAVSSAPTLRFQRWAPDEPEAAEILARMGKVYAGCRSYSDSGVVEELTFFRGKRTARMPFTTAFVRPDRFRYEVRRRRGEEEFDRCLVWRNDQDVREWWDVRPGVVQLEFASSLGAATVVSAFSAPTIPALLSRLPEVRVTSLSNPQRMEDEELAHASCFVVQGGWMAGSMTLWIDRQSLFLRQTLTENPSNETRTTYEPVLDAEIPESLLVFDPPVPAAR